MKPYFKDDGQEHGSEEIVGPGGFEQIAEAVRASVDRVMVAGELAAVCESPIEIEFGVDLLRGLAGSEITVVPQYRWRRFRIDFALLHEDVPLVFIECDGKEFHSTPEQLANDRRKDAAAKQAGIPLLRFPGSDIFKNSAGCAMLAIAVARQR